MILLFDLHGFPNLLLAGAEAMAYSIGKFLVRQGHTVNVLVHPVHGSVTNTNVVKGEYEIDGIKVVILPDDATLHELYDKCNVVITHFDRTRDCIKLAKQYNKPVSILVHSPRQLRLDNIVEGEVQLLIYNALSTAKEVRFPNTPSILVYPPVFVKDYQTDLTKARDQHTLVNLNLNKGGPLFWSLADEFHNESDECFTKFLGVVGGYGDQIIKDEITCNPNTTILPTQLDMKLIYEQTHVLLMPSKNETWGRVGVEAFCSGIPVIACPTPGLVEALGKDNALWAEHNDTKQWYEAIVKLRDPDTYMEFSQKGLKRAEYLEQKSEVQLHALANALESLCYNNRSRIFSIVSELHHVEHLAPIMHGLPLENTGITALAHDNTSICSLDALEKKSI